MEIISLPPSPGSIPHNAQIWPGTQNSDINGTADSIYLIIIDIGTKSGSGMDYTLGQVLERFYCLR